MTAYTGPLPEPGLDDRDFWLGCKRQEFLLLKCAQCGQVRAHGQPMCASCASFETESFAASGAGTLWTWTTTYHVLHSVWREQVPYTIAVVELREGPHFTTMLVDCPPEEIRAGMPVEVTWEEVNEEFTLPKFRPARERAS